MVAACSVNSVVVMPATSSCNFICSSGSVNLRCHANPHGSLRGLRRNLPHAFEVLRPTPNSKMESMMCRSRFQTQSLGGHRQTSLPIADFHKRPPPSVRADRILSTRGCRWYRFDLHTIPQTCRSNRLPGRLQRRSWRDRCRRLSAARSDTYLTTPLIAARRAGRSANGARALPGTLSSDMPVLVLQLSSSSSTASISSSASSSESSSSSESACCSKPPPIALRPSL